MTKKAAGKAAEAQAPAREKFIPPQDEHHGKGGSYVLDKASGTRALKERTQDGDADDGAATAEQGVA